MKSPELHQPSKETILRNSRRRKSINYTLPSLKQKMRRESEKFVDAVIINKKEELKNRRKTISGLGNIKKFKIHQDHEACNDFGTSSDNNNSSNNNKNNILKSVDPNAQKHKRRKTIMVDKSKNEDKLDNNSRRKSVFDLVDDDDDDNENHNYYEEYESDNIGNSNENIYRKRFDKVNKFSSEIKKTSRRYTLNTYGSN
ncbi:unnamed protein product [[Candida] boidinii]|nr:unnamed protein product [[Candida] boidinii]GMG15337.1 unnamed protein product [[Candida] boidinii]